MTEVDNSDSLIRPLMQNLALQPYQSCSKVKSNLKSLT